MTFKKILLSLSFILVLTGCTEKKEPVTFDEHKLEEILNTAIDDTQAFEMIVNNMNTQLTYMKTEETVKLSDGSIVRTKIEDNWKVDNQYVYESKNSFDNGLIIWAVVGTEKMVNLNAEQNAGTRAAAFEEDVPENQDISMFSYIKGSFDLTLEKNNQGAIFKTDYTVTSSENVVTEIHSEYTVNKAGFITHCTTHAVNPTSDITYEIVHTDFNSDVTFDYEQRSTVLKDLNNKEYEDVKKEFDK